MIKISLCMIVKNEESVLRRCLDSVRELADEIVIVDTGSTDSTESIAKQYTDKVFSTEWKDDFSLARNFSFERATCDYILWLDADDYISPDQREIFGKLKEIIARESPDMVMCPYDVSLDKNGNPLFTFYRERIVRNRAGFRWEGRVHECIPPRGKTMRADFRVTHLKSEKPRGDRNLRIYQKWIAEGAQLSGRDKFYYGRELFYNRLYAEAAAVLEDMLAGNGWYVNKIEACKILADCHTAEKDGERALCALFRSFLYGEPRASVMCKIAHLYKKRNKLREAVYFYECAARCGDHLQEGDFEEPTCRTLIPFLELTCCYEELGEKERALLWHKKAEEAFPEHPSVVYNQEYFRKDGRL